MSFSHANTFHIFFLERTFGLISEAFDLPGTPKMGPFVSKLLSVNQSIEIYRAINGLNSKEN